jgi:hypothetical protein
MTTFSTKIGSDKLAYKQITIDDLKSKKGYYYNPNFYEKDLAPIQGKLHENGNYSLVIFQNKDSIEDTQPIPTTIKDNVKLEDGEISIEKYDTLSPNEQQKYSLIDVPESMGVYKKIKYKLKPVVKVIEQEYITKDEYLGLSENDKNAYYKNNDNDNYYLVTAIKDEFYKQLRPDIKNKFKPETRIGTSGIMDVVVHDKKSGGGGGGEETHQKVAQKQEKKSQTTLKIIYFQQK